jgi:cytochrome c553
MSRSKWLHRLLPMLTWGAVLGAAAAEVHPPQEYATQWQYREEVPLSEQAKLGQRLYLEGVRADGTPLTGVRQLGQSAPASAMGAQAACVQCHRRSGLGAVEGDILISPITGRALFNQGGVAAVMDTRSKKYLSTAHEPYTTETLGRALREGRHVGGRDLHTLMPRYLLSDAEVLQVEAYLNTLSPTWSPGVSAKRIRIASVITPDVDAGRRKVAVEMIRDLVNRKNLGTRPGRRHMVSALEFVLRTERHWEHEIWELSGPKETWLAQLRERQAEKPVFAIASGVVGDGAALHEFCESEKVPCWFPVADALPVSAGTDFYGMYFNAGVVLEAQVLAKQVGSPGRVVQVLSDDAVSLRAADAFDAQRGGAASRRLVVGQAPPAELAQALGGLGSNDALLLWLRADDLTKVSSLAVPRAPVWMGTRLADGEQSPLSEPWRAKATMAYTYELPWQRVGNTSAMRAWLGLNNKPLVYETMQSELYFAFNYLNETAGDLLNNLHREYLLERADMMLGRREIAQSNAQMIAQRSLRNAALNERLALETQVTARTDGVPQVTMAELTAQREGTTVYPRLTLGPGQRFASKGAYLVHLTQPGEARSLVTDSIWLVP